MRTIPLSNSKDSVLVDDDVYQWARLFTWSFDRLGYVRSSVKVCGIMYSLMLSRVALDAPEGYRVRFRDGGRLDHRRCNLAIGTKSARRRRQYPKFVGVRATKDGFKAFIRRNGQEQAVGTFLSMDRAAIAHDVECFKDRALYRHMNFPLYDADDVSPERQSRHYFVRSKRRNTSSKFVGVCHLRNRNRWRATIREDGRLIHLGDFRDEESAARAYDEQALRLRGRNTLLNFPNEAL